MVFFSSPIFTEGILPFLLIFVVVFAILQKSKILGDNQKQVNSLTALVIGLILVAFPGPRNIVVGLMPWIGVGVAVLLVFFILYGFVAGDLTKMPKGFKIVFGVLAGLFTIGVVLFVTGLYKTIFSIFKGIGSSEFFTTVIFIIIIITAVAFVLISNPKTSEK